MMICCFSKCMVNVGFLNFQDMRKFLVELLHRFVIYTHFFLISNASGNMYINYVF